MFVFGVASRPTSFGGLERKRPALETLGYSRTSKRWATKMRWPLTLYTKELPHGAAGSACGPLIRIRKGYESDDGLYQHELRHVKQWLFVGVTVGALIASVARLLELESASLLVQLAAWAFGVLAALSGHELLYACSKVYRAWSEADAYRTQMRFPYRTGLYLSPKDAAARLAGRRYRLGITIERARELLR